MTPGPSGRDSAAGAVSSSAARSRTGRPAAVTGKTLPRVPPASPRRAWAIEDAIRSIVASDEPAVVLSSLARLSIPSFSDACAVELSEGTRPLFQIRFPMADEAACSEGSGSVLAGLPLPACASRTFLTTFEARSEHGYPSFAGVVMHSWTEHDPGEDDAIIARLLVERALAIVRHQRLAEALARAERRAAKLAIDASTSRIEGEAIGIVMAKHRIAPGEALNLLRQVARVSQREMQVVAADVVLVGDLRPLPGNHGHDPPPRHGFLHLAVSNDPP